MKHVSVLASFALATIGATPFDAHAATLSHFQANGIAANNISVMQHSIMLNALDNFDTTMAFSIGKRNVQPIDTPDDQNIDPDKLYGKMPVYGSAITYGEYGDDGTVFLPGRSGGDEFASLTTPNDIWFAWQHADDYAKFDNIKHVDSGYDLVSFGVNGGHRHTENAIAEWGAFGGVIIADEDTSNTDIDEHGGYIGLYRGYHIYGFNIAASANMGVLFNSAESVYGTDEFSNFWFGGMLNTSYNIVLDNTFTLQPGIYLGYTWIKSPDYLSVSGDKITNQNLNMFEVSPSVRAIKHIVSDWYGALSARYVFNTSTGGNEYVNDIKLQELDLMNYSEYGIALEKNIDRFNFTLSLNRRDGGRTGWLGGLQVRYVF